MGLEIFPQVIEVFPNDQRVFEVRATYPPPFWKIPPDTAATGTGIAQLDSSLRWSRSPGVIQATGAFQLASGLGAVDWTLIPGSLSGASSYAEYIFALRGTISGSDWQYLVRIGPSDVTIRNESTTLLKTISVTPYIGQRYRVEIASGFRLYIDGNLEHERVSLSGTVLYPAFYRWTTSGANLPSVLPAPVLSGDWQLLPLDDSGNPIVLFSVEHGSLSAGANALQKIYSGGTVPGQYKLRTLIEPGLNLWVEDAAPAGSSVSTGGGVWAWGTGSPAHFSGTARLKSPNAAEAFYFFDDTTDTLQINKDDVIICYVFIDATNPTTEIMLQFKATDATGLEHRAYWGANSILNGVDGTPSRRRIGDLPPTGQWVRLEVKASLVDLEGRVLKGMIFATVAGICSFDRVAKYPSKLQAAESTIVIPPLQILGDNPRTLKPGVPVRFQTNYDIAQTDIVTWSVVSGSGSFTQEEFFTPSAPGTTVVRASSTGNQAADLTLNIPAIITPEFTFAGPSEQIDWNTNIVSPVFSASAGSINSSSGVWTAPSGLGQIVKITATNVFTATRDVLIMSKFPITRTATPVEGERRKKVLISEAEDGTEVTRVKNKDGKSREYYSVRITLLTLADFNTILAFWEEFHPAKPFIWEDVPQGIRGMFKFDSDMPWREIGSGRFEVAFRVKSVVV